MRYIQEENVKGRETMCGGAGVETDRQTGRGWDRILIQIETGTESEKALSGWGMRDRKREIERES